MARVFLKGDLRNLATSAQFIFGIADLPTLIKKDSFAGF